MSTLDQRVHRVFVSTVHDSCSWEDWRQLDSLSDFTSLDSMAVLCFLTGLEREFEICFPAEDLELELFTDRPRLLAYLERMTGSSSC